MSKTIDHSQVFLREATLNDLEQIVALLHQDILGSRRESPDVPIHKNYIHAFESIDKDPNNNLLVLEYKQEVIGTLQLTFIPSLTYQGAWRAQIEGVRIKSDYRSQRLGQCLIQESITLANKRNCKIIQLTCNKQRTEAIKFYESLRFHATHEGFKLEIPE